MNHWKLPLHPTQPVSATDVLKAVLVCSLFLTGCSRNAEVHEVYTAGQWISDLCAEAGVEDYRSSDPYYASVTADDCCFEAVQAAVEWGILSEGMSFLPDEALSRELAAHTLLMLDEGSDGWGTAQEEVEEAVSKGYVPAEFAEDIHAEVGEEEAGECLRQTLKKINSRTFETKAELPAEMKPITVDEFDEDSLTAYIEDAENLGSGDYAGWRDDTGTLHLYRIDEILNTEEGNLIQFSQPDLTDFEEYEIQGEFEADFSQAEIHTEYGDEEESAFSSLLTLLSAQKLQKTFKVKDFKVTITSSGTSLKADVYRPLSNGAEIYADLMISGVRASYRLRKNSEEDSSYFKVSYTSTESAGLRDSSYKAKFGDFSEAPADNLLAALKSMSWKSRESEDNVLTLCTVELPIPSAPAVSLTMSLDLHLSASGKAEIVLTQKNILGAETRNGRVRLIKEISNSRQAVLKASASVMAGIRFSLNMLKRSISDLTVKAGAKSKVTGILHIYDEEGELSSHTVECPDIAEELSDGNPDAVFCSDINAYAVLTVSVNGSESLLNRAGLGRSWSILNESNAPVLAFLNHHYENGIAVDACTAGSRKKLPQSEQLKISDTLLIKDYSLIMSADETASVTITAVPEGYSKSSLLFSSTNEEIAVVDEKGNVTALSPGNAEIVITTEDEKYKVQCSVFVSRSF